MLKIGVLGAGELGNIHLNILRNSNIYELVGFHDPDLSNSVLASKEHQIKHFSNAEELIDKVDVVDIVSSTVSHYHCAQKALRNSKHVFIEKPIAHSLEEARNIINLSNEANVKIQVGHAERFNPAFIAAKDVINQPLLLDSQRIVEFSESSIDTSVVLDLMIYDIDIILNIVKSSIKKISATGVNIINGNPDIVNARIEFDNGCVANLTASRLGTDNVKKTLIYQKDASISIDFLNEKTQILNVDGCNKEKVINLRKPITSSVDTIEKELLSFSDSILNDTIPQVTADDGFNALSVAHIILDKLKDSPHLINY